MFSTTAILWIGIPLAIGVVLKLLIEQQKCAVCAKHLSARDRKNAHTHEIDGKQKAICGYCHGAMRRKASRNALNELEAKERRRG